jgi:N-acetylglucosaminyldiphosphoundecaprenol N-acetyl-beta-D-mannosaminyltransferase
MIRISRKARAKACERRETRQSSSPGASVSPMAAIEPEEERSKVAIEVLEAQRFWEKPNRGNSPPRFSVLNVGVSAVTLRSAVDVIESWICKQERNFVCVRDVHGLVLCQDDADLAQIHRQAGMVTPDGMPLVWIGRRAGHDVERVCGPDLLPAVCARSVNAGYRHFFYGGAPNVAQRLRGNLNKAYPGLRVVGTFTPPFRPLTGDEEKQIAALINTARPDILWIGLSTPKQEQFMAAHIGRLDVPVMIGIGAAFDIHAGVQLRAPRWLRATGFEWLWRFVCEPRRLGRRYLVTIPPFIWLVARDMIGARLSRFRHFKGARENY